MDIENIKYSFKFIDLTIAEMVKNDVFFFYTWV